ncbi:Bax inhibitor-1 family protein [bacterium]|nr:Bax inhibitor-1 family protein [bacterium]
MFDMFDTLLSKTFLILAVSLAFCYFGAQAVLGYFRKLKNTGSPYVTAVYNEKGQEDLIVDPSFIMKPFWISFILNIVFFVILLFCKQIPVINMLAMLAFVFSDGVTLGLVLITKDENLGIQVAQLTTLAVFLCSLIGMFSGIDFSFLGSFLFMALIALIVVSIFRIFVRINGVARKVCASFGIFIFCGYLLFDFNRLVRFGEIAAANTWNTALSFALNIYLDIINLFLQILDLLSNSN